MEEKTVPSSKKTHKNYKVKTVLWITIPPALLLSIILILHNWLGYWLILVSYKKIPVVSGVSYFMCRKAPLFFVGKGMAKHSWGQRVLYDRGEESKNYLADHIISGKIFQQMWMTMSMRFPTAPLN